MFRSLGLAIGLALSAMPVYAQQSASEYRLEGVYGQLGADVGYRMCEAAKIFGKDSEKVAIYAIGGMTDGEVALFNGVFELPKGNPYREIFEYNVQLTFDRNCGHLDLD